MIFHTSLSPEQVTVLFQDAIKQYSQSNYFTSNNIQFIGSITDGAFVLQRVSNSNNQKPVIHGAIYKNLNYTVIAININNTKFFIKWLLVLLFGSISVVATYKMLEAANFSLFVLVPYLLTMFAYVIPTRLFEYECYEAKTFIEKTFQANEITETEL
jgi:hypothetical protein